jgi:hypothetical protein
MAQPNGNEAQKKLATLVENGRAKAGTSAPPVAPVNGG